MVDSTGSVAAGRRTGWSRRRERPQLRLDEASARTLVAYGGDLDQFQRRAARGINHLIMVGADVGRPPRPLALYTTSTVTLWLVPAALLASAGATTRNR